MAALPSSIGRRRSCVDAARSACTIVLAALVSLWPGAEVSTAPVDVSPPPILQWFESSYRTIEERVADLFLAGYGFVWLPPPFRADQGSLSVGYDVYDRFDLGRPGNPTLYGTEEGLKGLAQMLHRAGLSLQVDFVINHAGFSDLSTPGFAAAGGYPGLAITLPNDIDGDFHSGFAQGEVDGRLQDLVDIAHEKNHRFIRNPVTPGDARNLPAGTAPAFGRLANVPSSDNRRFYPDIGHNTIRVFDPVTNEGNIAIHAYNQANPAAGDPVVENAMGYLMRNAQWLIQVIGVDGLRVDAAKHVRGFVLDLLDRAVYRRNPRRLLDGSQSHVWTYTEVMDANPAVLMPHVKKTINPADPGRVGGNRDTLDFKLYFALKDNLERTGVNGAWQRIKDSALDVVDDGLHNGSAGVSFAQNHDVFKPFALEHVAQAFTLLMPGNTIVYFNGREFGDEREFPKPGRGDALSVARGSLLTRLVEARHTHGRGNYAERWDGTDGLFAFERQGSALVLLSNRGDAGFDSRTLTDVGFAPGTLLVELTGNADDPDVNPDRPGGPDIARVLRVFEENGVSKVNVRFQRPATIRPSGQTNTHGRGLLVYGLPTPESELGIELTNVASIMDGSSTPATDRENGRQRQADIHVIRNDTFDVRLKTRPVRLLGSNDLRDVAADGDAALLRVDAGRDVNGNGAVDFRTAGSLEYGFERFRTTHRPLVGPTLDAPRGDGVFVQRIDATRLEEGMHFITARVYRHRTDAGPAVFREFRRVVYVDRRLPAVALEKVTRAAGSSDAEVLIRSVDATANSVHVFTGLPSTTTDSEISAMVTEGKGRADRIDRALFRAKVPATGAGPHQLTVVALEPSGTRNILRLNALIP